MDTRGGIATFVRTIRDTPLWTQWHIGHVATHRNGTIPARVAAFGIGLLHLLYELIFRRPDVVHIHMSSYGSFYRKSVLAWICFGSGVPVVLHVHGSRFHTFFEGAPGLVRRLISATLARADVAVALGDTWANRLRDIAPGANVVVVPNAIRPKSPVDHCTADSVHVVFLGEVGDRKGTFTLLDAWAKTMAHTGGRLSARLTIAGDGEVERARRRVAELGVSPTVDVRGWIATSHVTQLLSGAHILVLPSQNEGQPMAILEAMSMGICVVASNVGGIPELIDQSCGVLVEPDRVSELADAILRVMTDHTARAQLGANALNRVKTEFDVDMVARRFDEMYHHLAR